jgi:hypothetical protein
MTDTAILAPLTKELKAIQAQWLDLGTQRKLQDELYATEFAPVFATLFSQLPLHSAPAEMHLPIVGKIVDVTAA